MYSMPDYGGTSHKKPDANSDDTMDTSLTKTLSRENTDKERQKRKIKWRRRTAWLEKKKNECE